MLFFYVLVIISTLKIFKVASTHSSVIFLIDFTSLFLPYFFFVNFSLLISSFSSLFLFHFLSMIIIFAAIFFSFVIHIRLL
jgi:hypothetical protein